jgi:hypothetical protein
MQQATPRLETIKNLNEKTVMPTSPVKDINGNLDRVCSKIPENRRINPFHFVYNNSTEI